MYAQLATRKLPLCDPTRACRVPQCEIFVIYRSYRLNGLLLKFLEFKKLAHFRIKYTLDNGIIFEFILKQTDFPHLIGLHKLVDIPLIGQFNDVSNVTVSAKFLISKIKKESQLTENIIKKSVYFPSIEQRYQHFSSENILSLTYTDAIVNFNAALIGSKLRGDYILFEKQKTQGYNYLSVAKDVYQKRYAESFFFSSDRSLFTKSKCR